MEQNEEKTMEEKVKQKINGGLRSTKMLQIVIEGRTSLYNTKCGNISKTQKKGFKFVCPLHLIS